MGKPFLYDKEQLGFLSLDWPRKDYGRYICAKCKEERESTRSAILKWQKAGIKYCPVCRNSTGVTKSKEYYEGFLPAGYRVLAVLKQQGNTKVQVLKPCGHEDTYSSRHILLRDTEHLACSLCKTGGSYASIIEQELTNYMLSTWPNITIEVQKPYKDIIPFSTRRFIQDIYIPDLNQILEITSKGNGFKGYFDIIEEKRMLAQSNNVKFFVVYDKTMIYDIVKSLLKNKETE